MATLTEKQAYSAMYYYIKHYWQTSQSEDLGDMLSYMSLLPDGLPIDAAVTADWNRAVEFALSGGEAGRFELKQGK